MSARPLPREIADNAGSRHRMLDELAHYGYRIVHPDDTPPWMDRNDWTEGWNDCRSAIFGDQCRAPECCRGQCDGSCFTLYPVDD